MRPTSWKIAPLPTEVTMDKFSYQAVWGTRLGKDTANLDKALARWLGARMNHLGLHTKSYPPTYSDDGGFELWREQLTTHGKALLVYADLETSECDEDAFTQRYAAAQDALRFAADNLGLLWD